MDEYYRAVRALPAWLARPLSALPPGIAEQVHEIRLRVGCGVQLTIGGKPCCPAELPALQKLRLTPLQMEEIFVTLCGGSVHSHETEIAVGYVTLSCGCRAGLAGQFYCAPGQSAVLQELRSVNVRVARNREFPLPQKLRDILQQRIIGMLLMGEPDSGKTTLLRILAGLETADGGSVTGLSGRKIAFVFQEDRLLPWITAQQNIRLAQPAGAKRPVGELLALAGLDSADGQKYPGQLSGGQRRRGAFLRGIAFLEGVKNGVLLLDEPFNGLDAEAAGKLCGMLRSLAPQTLVLLVSHQLAPLQALDVSFFFMDQSF